MNFVEEPKQRHYDKALEEKAIEFHGHGGPFMIIGLRMGLQALNTLDAKGWFRLKCNVLLHWAPPDSCVIDGIQSSTGCTMGKRNITVTETDGVAAEFTLDEKHVRITLRDDVLQKVRGVMDLGDEEVTEFMNHLAEAPAEALFQVDSL